MRGMFSDSKAAVERAIESTEVMLRAWAREITWFEAAEIVGLTASAAAGR